MLEQVDIAGGTPDAGQEMVAQDDSALCSAASSSQAVPLPGEPDQPQSAMSVDSLANDKPGPTEESAPPSQAKFYPGKRKANTQRFAVEVPPSPKNVCSNTPKWPPLSPPALVMDVQANLSNSILESGCGNSIENLVAKQQDHQVRLEQMFQQHCKDVLQHLVSHHDCLLAAQEEQIRNSLGQALQNSALLTHRISQMDSSLNCPKVTDQSDLEPDPKEEDQYDHVGLVHLEAIGGASASLALISTLVFSICLGSMSGSEFSQSPVFMNYLCVSTSCSVYTTCYSVLEYYYSQMFKGVDSFLANRLPKKSQSSLSINGHGNADQERAKLVKDVRFIFATLNSRRAAARNSMWLGLVCLVISAITQIDILADFAPDIQFSSSTSASLFFSSFTCMAGPAWYALRSPDTKIYLGCSVLGGTISTGEALLLQSGFPTSKISALMILLSVVIHVPATVKAFRGPLLPIVKKYVDVF